MNWKLLQLLNSLLGTICQILVAFMVQCKSVTKLEGADLDHPPLMPPLVMYLLVSWPYLLNSRPHKSRKCRLFSTCLGVIIGVEGCGEEAQVN